MCGSFGRFSQLSKFFFDCDDPLGTVWAEAREHRVDVGIHLEERLDHLADRRGSWVLGKDFAALFHLLHLVAHDDHNRAFA